MAAQDKKQKLLKSQDYWEIYVLVLEDNIKTYTPLIQNENKNCYQAAVKLAENQRLDQQALKKAEAQFQAHLSRLQLYKLIYEKTKQDLATSRNYLHQIKKDIAQYYA